MFEPEEDFAEWDDQASEDGAHVGISEVAPRPRKVRGLSRADLPVAAEDASEEQAGGGLGEPGEGAERVSKLIARAGIASRRAAEELIASGAVSVNGHFITEPGVKADPARDRVMVNGKPLPMGERATTVLLFHKPRNVMTTRDDPGKRATVFDYLPHKYQHLHPVGRLDFDTSGVLLLTDDGELTHLLTHPSHGAEKTYEARVRGTVGREAISRLQQGLLLEDGPTSPCKARVLAQREKNALVEITLREGRNRQVRRMLEAVGHPVSALRRTDFCGVELEGLLPGVLRVLLPGEVRALRKRVENKVKRRASSRPARPLYHAPAEDAKPAKKAGSGKKAGSSRKAPAAPSGPSHVPRNSTKADQTPSTSKLRQSQINKAAKRAGRPAPPREGDERSPLADRVARRWKS